MRKTGTHFFAGLVHPARCDLLVSLHELQMLGVTHNAPTELRRSSGHSEAGVYSEAVLRSRLAHDDFGSVDPKSSSAILIIESGISAKRRSQLFRIPLEQWLAAGARK